MFHLMTSSSYGPVEGSLKLAATRWVTHSPTSWIMHSPPFGIYVENIHFDWFNRCLCTGHHFQSDLDIFRFDFMFTKPHDVPSMFCFNVQTDMRFLLQQLLAPNFYNANPLDGGAASIKNLVSVWTLKQIIGGTSRGFISILHFISITFSAKISEAGRCIFSKVAEWVTRRE